MKPATRTIASEIALSAVIAVGSVIVLPKLFDTSASIDYGLAFIVFLLCSMSFVAYEFITRRAS